jgi:hypothetical protein
VIEAIIYQYLNPQSEVKDKVSRHLEAFVQKIEALSRERASNGDSAMKTVVSSAGISLRPGARLSLASVSLVIAPFVKGAVKSCMEVQFDSELFGNEIDTKIECVDQSIVPSVEGVINKAEHSMVIFRPVGSMMSKVTFEKTY